MMMFSMNMVDYPMSTWIVFGRQVKGTILSQSYSLGFLCGSKPSFIVKSNGGWVVYTGPLGTNWVIELIGTWLVFGQEGFWTKGLTKKMYVNVMSMMTASSLPWFWSTGVHSAGLSPRLQRLAWATGLTWPRYNTDNDVILGQMSVCPGLLQTFTFNAKVQTFTFYYLQINCQVLNPQARPNPNQVQISWN